MSEKRLLFVILILFLLLGAIYALQTPVFEASDELWHYPMVRHLADGNPLPVQTFDPGQAGPWKQEASQPPLYYWVGAALTLWIDTSDMETIRWLNPHVDNGLITVDGNTNLVVHDPASNPWQGTLLAVRLVRLASVLMGAVTVYMTYRLGKQVMPNRPEVSLGSAAIVAFMPMFLFISGAVNNDNLAIMLASVALVLIIALVRRPPVPRLREIGHTLLLGAVIGLGLLTKEGTIALLPLAWGALLMRRWVLAGTTDAAHPLIRKLTPRSLLRMLAESLLAFLLLCIPAFLIAGWWYYRNLVLYGDWLGWSAFLAVLGQRAQPASLAQLWDERWGFLMSYWGLFGGVNIPMWDIIYRLLNTLLLASLVGFMLYLVQQARTWLLRPLRPVATFAGRLLDLVVRYFPLVVCLLFSAAVIYGLVNWAAITWSSQGRLVFTALSALSVLLVVGLVGWLPPRPAGFVVAALSGFMFLIAAVAPFLWIGPAYQPATHAPPRTYDLQPRQVDFAGDLQLTGYSMEPAELGTTSAHPGDSIDVVLAWQVLRPMQEDWSVFVHLNDPVLDTPVAQRDMYHGQGLRPTSLLTPGEELLTYYRLTIPETTVAPAQLELVAGLYDFHTGVRLSTGEGNDAATLSRLTVEPAPGEHPNPTSVNFGDAIELLGYDLTPRRADAGETVMLTLYWQPGPALDEDYTFFAQVLDEDATRWASADIAPPGGTSNAPAGVQTLTLPLPLDPDTPPDVYPVIIGIYSRSADGAFLRLQIVEEGRITMADHLELTKLRIVGE